MRYPIISLCLLGSHVVACAPKLDAVSSPTALVSNSELKQAGNIAAQIDYLPTTYVNDGCYARSRYVSMELAAADIPSSAQIVSTCHSRRDAPDLLRLPDGNKWNWHVAPLFVVDGEPYIIDLAFSIRPLKRSEWLAYFQGRQNNGLRRYFLAVSGSDPNGAWGSDSPAICGKDLGLETLISSIKEMKPFREDNLLSNCAQMAAHIRKEPELTYQQREEKVQRLVERSIALHEVLRKKGLLEGGFDSRYQYKTPEDFMKFTNICFRGEPDK